jgi:hypothetical protein
LPEDFEEYMGSMHAYMPLYLCLWTEGLACHVSQIINPRASLSEVVFDRTLAEEDPKNISVVAKQFASAFSSTASSDHARFFSAGCKGALSARSGYSLGLLVAQCVARKHPI